MQYRSSLPEDEWLMLLNDTKRCIIQYPNDFFCGDLPSKKIIAMAVHLVFEGFTRDLHIRKVQAFRN